MFAASCIKIFENNILRRGGFDLMSLYKVNIRYIVLSVLVLILGGCSSSTTVIPPESVNVGDYEYLGDRSYIHGLAKGDIFLAYPELELRYKYATELSRETFMKSEEAKKIREEMKEEYRKLLQTTYKISIEKVGEYDTEREAFKVNLGMAGDISEGKLFYHCAFEEVPAFRMDHPFVKGISATYVLIPVKKKEASQLEATILGKSAYLVFNLRDGFTELPVSALGLSFKASYPKTKNVGLVVVDRGGKTLYAVKFSDFDERKVWKKVDSAKVASLSPLQQAPLDEDIKAESKESIEQLPQSVRKEVSQQSPSEQRSEPTSVFNEELLGVKYMIAVENGIVYCNVDDSWVSISDNEKRNFLRQIGQKKYFGKTQFIAKDSKGVNLAEYKNGSIEFFRTDSKGKARVNSLERYPYPVQQGKLSDRDEQDWQRRIEIARNRVKDHEKRIEVFKRDLEIAQRNPREARDNEESLRSILRKEEKKLDEARQEYDRFVEAARKAGIKQKNDR